MTGVQTCALPIYAEAVQRQRGDVVDDEEGEVVAVDAGQGDLQPARLRELHQRLRVDLSRARREAGDDAARRRRGSLLIEIMAASSAA